MLMTCPLSVSFVPAPSFWREHTCACMFCCKYTFFYYYWVNNWNCALIPCFFHRYVIRACDQTFLSSDWPGKGRRPFPHHLAIFWSLDPQSEPNTVTHRSACQAPVLTYHRTQTSMWEASTSVRYVQIFLSASHIFILLILHVLTCKNDSDTAFQIFCQDNLSHSTWYHICHARSCCNMH